MKRRNTHKGQSLIEILVATGIIAVVLVGVSDLITRSMNLSSFQANKNAAVNIAQNQLNFYRQARDQQPMDFFQDPVGRYSTCVGTIDPMYSCQIIYTVEGSGLKMQVNVSWTDGDKNVVTTLSQFLAKPTR